MICPSYMGFPSYMGVEEGLSKRYRSSPSARSRRLVYIMGYGAAQRELKYCWTTRILSFPLTNRLWVSRF